MNTKVIITLLCASQLVAGYDITGIGNILNDITLKITNLEQNVHQNFVKNLNQTFSQVVQRLKVAASSFQTGFQNQLAQFRNTTQDISDCVKAEQVNFNNTLKTAKEAVQNFATQVQNQVAPVRQQAMSLFTNALGFVNTTKQQLQTCANSIFFAQFPCYLQIVPTATLQGAALGKQLIELDVNAKIAAANALIAFQNAAQQEVSTYTSQLSAIGSEAMTCIRNKVAATTTTAAASTTAATVNA